MSDHSEVLISSDSSGLLWTACVWDSRTGTSLMNYKGGGVASPRALSLLGNDYLVSGEGSRPIMHIWPINSQETSPSIERIVTPGCVGALAVSPNNSHIVFSCGEKVFVWELATGELISVATRHFRTVSCIKFTDESSHFVTGGLDGMIFVWSLARIISARPSSWFLQQADVGQADPTYVFANHSLPVTDLFIGHGGFEALMVSVSGDHTCKIYSLAGGILLLSLVFDSALTSVTMSCNELDVFVGSVRGNIHHFAMGMPPRTLDYHLTKDEMAVTFAGHTKAVTCLSVSLDGIRLLSGSQDGKVIIWDIESRQCLKVLIHKGPVNNAYFTVCPKQMFSSHLKPSVIVQNFKRDSSAEEKLIYVTKKEEVKNNVVEKLVQFDECKEGLETEVQRLKKINKDLYMYSVEKVLKTLNNES